MGNQLIDEMPEIDRAALEAACESFTFAQGDVLHEAGDAFDQVIFIDAGVVAAMYQGAGGAFVQTGLMGPEACIPTLTQPVLRRAHCRFVALTAGRCRRVAAAELERLAAERSAVRMVLANHAERVHHRDHASVACATLHGVRERLAMLLLRLHDRLNADHIFLTQAELAGLLGARRTTVNHEARHLQRQGVIRYARGHLVIKNRARLESTSCGCHASETVASHLP